MTSRLDEIEFLLKDNWFISNPSPDVNEYVSYLVETCKRYEAVLKKAGLHMDVIRGEITAERDYLKLYKTEWFRETLRVTCEQIRQALRGEK